jgi:hypothetical protein
VYGTEILAVIESDSPSDDEQRWEETCRREEAIRAFLKRRAEGPTYLDRHSSHRRARSERVVLCAPAQAMPSPASTPWLYGD